MKWVRFGGIAAVAVLLPSLSAVAASLQKVGPDVRERLAVAPRARVMVYLSVARPELDRLDELRGQVARVQQSVIDRAGVAEVDVRRRFQTVPAFAAEVTGEQLDRLEVLSEVVRIDLDAGGGGSLAQAVPLTNTNLVQAAGLTGTGVTVAVLDSGIDTDHTDLADSLVGEACFCSGSGGCCPAGGSTQTGTGAAEDDNGHGSNVSGIVTSNGIVSPVGTAPDASIVAVKVLDSNNSFCCSSDVVAGLDWIIANRPDVDLVNMSLGTSAMYSGNCDTSNAFTMAYAAAIDTLRANGVLSFVSTGNNGSVTQMQAPACVANAISVGAVWDSNVGSQNVFCFEATTAADKITCFTNRNFLTDLFAPGAPITSDYNNGGTSTFYGTSQASPHCAGCAADLLEAFPGLDPTVLENALEATGVPVTDPATSIVYPRVNCLQAMRLLACRDDDGDTFHVSVLCPAAGGVEDCDDGNASTYPGAAEVCDGLDNDCDGSVPAGELAPPSNVATLLGDRVQYAWAAAPLADDYDVVSGDLATLRASGGDFAAATQSCESDGQAANAYAGLADPPAGVGVWVLVRGSDCAGAGSYDSGGPSQVASRDAGIGASGVGCPP